MSYDTVTLPYDFVIKIAAMNDNLLKVSSLDKRMWDKRIFKLLADKRDWREKSVLEKDNQGTVPRRNRSQVEKQHVNGDNG